MRISKRAAAATRKQMLESGYISSTSPAFFSIRESTRFMQIQEETMAIVDTRSKMQSKLRWPGGNEYKHGGG